MLKPPLSPPPKEDVWENTVYNRMDQVVMQQDAKQQLEPYADLAPGKYYTFYNYDGLGRDRYTKEEHIGAIGKHEATHVTDKKSRGFQNPKSTYDEIENAPRIEELKHYKELDDIKKKQL